MRQIKLIIAALLVISPFAANAGIIWDEAVDGDLGTFFPGTVLGLIADDSSIIGTLDGGIGPGAAGADEFDAVTVSFDGTWTLDISDVFGQSLFVALQMLNGDLIGSLQVGVPNTNNMGVSANNVFGEVAAGDYVVQFIPSGNDGELSYVATFNVRSVPEPATLALLGLGLAGMGLRRKKV